MGTQLILTALRVLTSCMEHTQPNPQDVHALRASLTEEARDWKPDALATYVVQRERERLRARAAGAGQ
jgi:hypothetical protein